MGQKLYNETDIQNIANSIRAKTGKAETMMVSEMSGEIDSISSGGSGGIIPDGYELQSVSMGYTFGGFDGIRIPLVEEKTFSHSSSISGGASASNSVSNTYMRLNYRVTNNNNANAYRASADASFSLSHTEKIWLGTDYETLKQKTSGTIIVWLEPVS